ncbi:hypothetical protein HGRIS_005009 [Hohenbuehelia grisea]|uniref:Uncharacterized protein n=1 Tax=Hohenbuehelia grisea TaxID=104357 RepID=A0ABR3JDX0_9AGAR
MSICPISPSAATVMTGDGDKAPAPGAGAAGADARVGTTQVAKRSTAPASLESCQSLVTVTPVVSRPGLHAPTRRINAAANGEAEATAASGDEMIVRGRKGGLTHPKETRDPWPGALPHTCLDLGTLVLAQKKQLVRHIEYCVPSHQLRLERVLDTHGHGSNSRPLKLG